MKKCNKCGDGEAVVCEDCLVQCAMLASREQNAAMVQAITEICDPATIERLVNRVKEIQREQGYPVDRQQDGAQVVT